MRLVRYYLLLSLIGLFNFFLLHVGMDDIFSHIFGGAHGGGGGGGGGIFGKQSLFMKKK